MAKETPAREYPGGAQALLVRVRGAKLMDVLCDSDGELLAAGSLIEYAPGEMLLNAGETPDNFRVALEGRLSVQRQSDSEYIALSDEESRECIGEASVMSGRPVRASVRADTRVVVLSLSGDQLWKLMQQCPPMRHALVAQLILRVSNMQSVAQEREKMVTIGTLTAGLMHELNNPGAAARRATSQLRENLRSLQEITLRMSAAAPSPEQKACIQRLLSRMFTPAEKDAERGSLETADREESFCTWMDSNKVPNCWKIAPALANSSLTMDELECARHTLPPDVLTDMLTWLEALGSSSELLQTIETSMQRITELVGAVKSYSYAAADGRPVEFMDTMRAAWLIVKHKFRTRNIEVTKQYAAENVKIAAPGIAQVWTNLLDNAADAVPEQGGRVQLRTRIEDGNLVVEIEDNGSGIPADSLSRIFEPFYTTKSMGKGTGFGLDIVSRFVKKAKGKIGVESEPGRTVFRVTLPLAS